MKDIKKVLTIAGSDSSGGAGIQADIKTITCLGLYAESVISAVTAQNTLGVKEIQAIDDKVFEAQLECVLEDIPPDAVKIGMISNPSQIEIIKKYIEKFNLKNIVVDPVMVSTSGCSLAEDKNIYKELFPLATVITPNIPEAEYLSKTKITTIEEQKNVAGILSKKFGASFLVKGGHLKKNHVEDFLYDKGNLYTFQGDFIDSKNTHGTGCTLSSAVACGLANGFTLDKAVDIAKKYVSGAIEFGLDIGKGNGPLFHGYNLK